MRYKLLIAEPSEIITCGIKSLLADSSCIVQSISDFSRLEERIISAKPDILLLNPSIFPHPLHNHINLFLNSHSSITIIALVYQYIEMTNLRLFDTVIDIRDSKVSMLESISEAIHRHSRRKNDADRDFQLTAREIDVLILLAKGMMSKEIAAQLNLSVHTVTTHRKNITRKTGIKSVAGLAVYAMLNNLTDATELE